MENNAECELLGAEHFDTLNEYMKYRLDTMRNTMGLTSKKNHRDLIIPKINFKKLDKLKENLPDKMQGLRISPDITNIRKNYRIIPLLNTNAKPPSNLYADLPSAVIQPSKMHIPIVLTEPEKPAAANIPANKDGLAFISDKTHSESKKILQGLQELYANVKELRNDPHQMMTIPEALDISTDLYTYFHLIQNKKTVECSTMGRVLSSSLKTRKKSLKFDRKYYDPYGKIKMFDFSTPCPY